MSETPSPVSAPPPHISVLLNGMLEALEPRPGQCVVDATLGAGGHSAAIIPRIGPGGRLIAIDADASVIDIARTRIAPLAENHSVGKRVAGAISARTQGGGGLGTDFELGGLVPEHCAQKPTQVTAKTPTTTSLRGGCFDVAPTLDAHYGDKQGLDNQHIDAGGGCSSVAKSLNSHGGRFDYETETFVTVGPLQSGGTPNGHGTAGINRQAVNSGHIIAIQERAISENEAAGPDGVGIREDGQAYTLEARTVPQAVAFESRYVRTPTMAVRRLTPRECERLQGHPDDSTLIQHRGKPATDGPRYKALGNSMVVPELRWIGERIAMVDALTMEVDK